MIDHLNSHHAQEQQSASSQTQKKNRVFYMRDDDRMAGSVPVWGEAKTSKQNVEQQLALAETGQSQETFEQALTYAGASTAENAEEFGFGDLVDMVNPLHHIPLVGHAYREVTGDEIKPIGKIIGGAVFGGPIGAGTGLVDTIVEEETGRGLGENAMAMLDGEMPQLKPQSADPEQRLNDASQAEQEELPASLLAFTDTPAKIRDNGISIERFDTFRIKDKADIARFDTYRIDVRENMNSLPARENITGFSIQRIK